MFYRFFISLISVLFISLWQFSLIGNLPSFVGHTNLVLVVLIFVLASSNLETALWWALGFGFVFDVYSFGYFGFYLIVFWCTALFINFALDNFFTNRSLYSFLALSGLATIFYKFLFFVLAYFFNFLSKAGNDFEGLSLFKNLPWEILANLLITMITFYLFNRFSRRLKPEFISKK